MSKTVKTSVIILDFGGQYNQLIARRVRSENVYCEILSYKTPIEKIKEINPNCIILTGGPNSIYEDNAPTLDIEIFNLNIPILGICYGAQLISGLFGGEVIKADVSEYGKTVLNFKTSPIFKDMKSSSIMWMSHTDRISKLPMGFKNIANSDNCEIAAFSNEEKKIYGVQFHPEVTQSEEGQLLLKNFIFNISKCENNWNMKNYLDIIVNDLKEEIKDKKVLLALSGGVDSTVAAGLLERAIGKNLTCVYVDHGFMRLNETEEIECFFKNKNLNFIKIDAKKQFLDKLNNIYDPETKRKIIGEQFIKVFEEFGKKFNNVDFLAQGTIYSDIVESGFGGESKTIKSHHNVGGLPENIKFEKIIEPLRALFKDEVRNLGLELGMSENIVFRQPFPGPGLAIRIIGEITEEKLTILKKADFILREEIKNNNLNKNINQYFTVLTNTKTVGVKGDFRTYEYVLAIRAVNTNDFMTAEFSKIPYDVLEKISQRITNEVNHISRIVYDITSKPPATIEWE